MGSDIGRLLEVGVAVNDLQTAGQDFSDMFRAPISDVIADESNFAIRFKMCRLGDVDFEVMETTSPNGLIRRFIDRNGEGLHHIAFLVEDADRLLEDMKARGLPVLSDRPVRMANLKAFFVRPQALGGILFEFVENLHPWLDGKTYSPRGGLPHDARPFAGAKIVGICARVKNLDQSASDIADALRVSFRPAHVMGHPGRRVLAGQIGNITLSLFEGEEAVFNGGGPGGQTGLHHISVEVPNAVKFLDGINDGDGHVVLGTLTDPAGRQETFIQSKMLHGMLMGVVDRR